MIVTSHFTQKVLKKLSVHDYNRQITKTTANDNFANKIYFKDKLFINGRYVENLSRGVRSFANKSAINHEVIAKDDLVELIWQSGFFVTCLPVAFGILGFMLF